MIPAIYHCSIQIISRSRGRSAVAAAAYRSGEKLTNHWDGLTHDYTRKSGVIHTEILLPPRAPPEYADRSTLWNAVEEVEKSRNAQLAREINVALPAELSREQQIELVREYCHDNFVSSGMCADFSIHDTGSDNPHAHIMLTMRPFKDDSSWDDKQKKVYHLDENGQKIYDPVKRQYDCETVPTTDWNEHTKAEEWRSSWASLTNRYLEQNVVKARVDHRSYKRQGIEKIPTIHLGSAATQMERRGIRTEKGDINRQIAADNKLMKELHARISRLYSWTKDVEDNSDTDFRLDVIENILKHSPDDSQYQKIRNLKNGAAVLNFMKENKIYSMDGLRQYIKDKNNEYYALRKQIVERENRISVLNEHLTMWDMYEENKQIRRQLDKVKPKKRDKFIEDHRAQFTLYESVCNYFDELKFSGEKIVPKAWTKERDKLNQEKGCLYSDMRKMKEEIRTIENIRKTLDEMTKDDNIQKDTPIL